MIYHYRKTNDDDDLPGDPYDLNGYGESVKTTIQALKERADEFDAIIVTGMSGVLVGGPVTLATGKPLAILRKPTDDCHAYEKYINARCLSGARVLFLDDFISMGETRQRCDEFVTAWGGNMTCEYLYGSAAGGAHPDGWRTLLKATPTIAQGD